MGKNLLFIVPGRRAYLSQGIIQNDMGKKIKNQIVFADPGKIISRS